jgi:hypothetical protein
MTIYKVPNNFPAVSDFREEVRRELRNDLNHQELANFEALLLEATEACKELRPV